MDEILIISTVDTMDLAGKIAHAIVNEGKAACVNIVPGIRSIYRWEGETCDDQELLLLIKTSGIMFDQARECIRRLHTYDTPEIIAVPIKAGDPHYLKWLHAQIRTSEGEAD